MGAPVVGSGRGLRVMVVAGEFWEGVVVMVARGVVVVVVVGGGGVVE